jgi:murein DD-endopeptidase MepM/ murein hydrolase activator NlpD
MLRHLCCLIFLTRLSLAAAPLDPLFKTVDLAVSESVKAALSDGSTAQIRLIKVVEHRGKVWGEVFRSDVTLEVNGERQTIQAGLYRLPVKIGGVQVDCPITGGLKDNSHINHWQLDRDARLRIWPGDSKWIRPDTFRYPVKQKWFASQTSFSNEPVAPRPRRQLYYHAGLDIGGAEALTEIISATDALVVSLGTNVLAKHARNTPVAKRYDVMYLLDSRGWYYRYSHLHSFDPSIRLGDRVKIGQRLGLIGKEGGSGGWTHLHFEISSRQPSGRWGTQEGYAFLWQAYLQEYRPDIIAIARPSYVAFTDQEVTFDGSKSWSSAGAIRSFEWTHADGTHATGPRTTKQFETPGTYFATLKVTDSEGRADYDFVRAKIYSRKNIEQQPPRLHLAYHPTLNLRPGTEITFKARAFYHTHGEEIWDFGDGSPTVRTRSDGNVKQLARDGYVILKHRYRKPGHYLVHVRRSNELGHIGEDRLHIQIGNQP